MKRQHLAGVALLLLSSAADATPLPVTGNERRAVGLQAPVTLTGDALMAELRDQRARDFYLGGQRLGDLRRYLRYNNLNLFPTGPYPGSTTGQVYDNTITCWPLPTSEVNANPNI